MGLLVTDYGAHYVSPQPVIPANAGISLFRAPHEEIPAGVYPALRGRGTTLIGFPMIGYAPVFTLKEKPFWKN
jgi:hypothetical protein